MPRRCCVPACKGNYKSEAINGSVSTFIFPKDPNLRNRWLKAISRENFIPSDSSVVCANHFDENLIIRIDSAVRDDGTILTVPRKVPKLHPEAVPHIFANQPSYRTTNSSVSKRKHPDERRKDVVKRENELLEKQKKANIINDFTAFKKNYPNHMSASDFKSKENEEFVLFYKLTDNDIPKITMSFKIFSNMTIQIWKENMPLSPEHIKISNFKSNLETWSQFEEIIQHLMSFNIELSSFRMKLEIIINILSQCTNDCADSQKASCLKFLTEQVELILQKPPKYSPGTIVLCYSLYLNNPGAYIQLRNFSILCLPHPGHLQRLGAHLYTEKDGIKGSHLGYLRQKALSLAPSEKIISLLLDEIYVHPSLKYKGGSIQGMSTNANSQASTIQTFMISSVLSTYKDVVALFPVKNLTAIELYDMTMQVLNILHTAGFIVLTIISDNNKINRKMFQELGNGIFRPSIINPVNPQFKMFLLFDTVHLLKNIRNNWFNQKDNYQTFMFPSFENRQEILHARVNDLKKIYFGEETNIIKSAPTLNRKVLFPSAFDRQKVSLATNLFHDKNVVALTTSSNKASFSGTAAFLNIIINWWKIINVKHTLKGRNLRDSFCDRIKIIGDGNIEYLKKFIFWLEDWNNLQFQGIPINSRHGKLTKETQEALKHTIEGLVQVSTYLLNVLNFDYVLLGKFQTDGIEARFSQYRQMSGGNYNVSVTQVFESEKKLKMLSILKLHSAKCGEFSVKDFAIECSKDTCKDKIEFSTETFDEIIEMSEAIEVSSETRNVLIFIAGYVAHAIMKSNNCCAECQKHIVLCQTLEVENSSNFSYLLESTRGGLKWPTDFLFSISVAVFQVFEMLISYQFEETFLQCQNQKFVLKELCLAKCQILLDHEDEKCKCGRTQHSICEQALNILANIMLNNYCKMKNNSTMTAAAQKVSKKRKISTLKNS